MEKDNEVDPKKELEAMKERMESLQEKIALAEKSRQTKLEKSQPLKTTYKWEAPDRVYSKKGRLWFSIISLFFILGIGFAAITQEILLIIIFILILFLIYLSNSIKPQLTKHEITNKGIKSGKEIWIWRNIDGFWISRRGEHLILIIDLALDISPDRIMLLVGSADPRKIVEILIEFIPYMNRKQISEDIINTFTTGSYLPLTHWLESEDIDKDIKEDKSGRTFVKEDESENLLG